ncbi:MAG: Hint domain-containing protein, partial [Aquabacterium sp.]
GRTGVGGTGVGRIGAAIGGGGAAGRAAPGWTTACGMAACGMAACWIAAGWAGAGTGRAAVAAGAGRRDVSATRPNHFLLRLLRLDAVGCSIAAISAASAAILAARAARRRRRSRYVLSQPSIARSPESGARGVTPTTARAAASLYGGHALAVNVAPAMRGPAAHAHPGMMPRPRCRNRARLRAATVALIEIKAVWPALWHKARVRRRTAVARLLAPRWLAADGLSWHRPHLIPPWDRPDRIIPRGRAIFVSRRHTQAQIGHSPRRRRAGSIRGLIRHRRRPALSQHPHAFAPGFAASPRSLLWNGTGMGAGTLVATPDGPVPASRLQRGGTVLGGSGTQLVLTEMHHLSLPAASFRRLGLAPPVQIAAGALGLGMPTAPLLLGPAQRLRLAGGWVAADLLVDGLGVRRLPHDAAMVLLGHGSDAPILAAGVMLAPAGAPASTGIDVAAATAALLRQADASGVPGGGLDGYVDQADRFGGSGWAIDTAAPARVVPLEVVVAGTVVTRLLADQPRLDLTRGPSRGLARHGFAWRFACPLPAGRIWMVEVRRAGAGAALPGTPLLFDAATTAPARFDTALAGLGDGTAEVRFLAQLIENTASALRR